MKAGKEQAEQTSAGHMADSLFPDGCATPAVAKRKNRTREGAGKSERSYIKHGLIRSAAGGQIAAYRRKHPDPILVIDGNAGDGIGVEEPQLDFFDENFSRPTPEILSRLAATHGQIDLLLCERSPQKRALLEERFPSAAIVDDHALAVTHIKPEHRYALWISDPCGPRDHGVEHMRAIADRLPHSDFVVVFNDGFINRLLGTRSGWETSCEKYPPMREPHWWIDQLNRRYLARTPVIPVANNFRCRILVISNFLSDAVQRRPFEVVL